jgi:hypothetical protein
LRALHERGLGALKGVELRLQTSEILNAIKTLIFNLPEKASEKRKSKNIQ